MTLADFKSRNKDSDIMRLEHRMEEMVRDEHAKLFKALLAYMNELNNPKH